ncbi:hypothetical protein [Schaalia sp. ZJ1691]|uniref:hypothetical protein n=1 Tax=Schaalia sp. ZJ1691 TaxID=2709404 RepID=UPI0013ED024B|nr:hypothetical protein [Schaalia sp. ZJ1691]
MSSHIVVDIASLICLTRTRPWGTQADHIADKITPDLKLRLTEFSYYVSVVLLFDQRRYHGTR